MFIKSPRIIWAMGHSVYFTKNIKRLIDTVIGDAYKDSVVVYHEMYDRPVIDAKQIIEWQRYRSIYQEVDSKHIVLVGLNRMIVPANRCAFVHEYLTTLTPNIPKVVIDTDPFIGEPWRLFFHYLFTNMNKFGYNYSYPIEGEWLKWFLRDTQDCRLSSDNIGLFIDGTYTDLVKLKTEFHFYEPTLEQIEWYAVVKEHVLQKYNTPKTWIAHLLIESNKKFGLNISFDSYLGGGAQQVPDLGVYRFLVEENQRRQGIYNRFTI